MLKALALLDAVENAAPAEPGPAVATPAGRPAAPVGATARVLPLPGEPAPEARPKVLLVDHQDSFVHTLADYLRQTGAEVVTYRAGFPAALLDRIGPDLLVLSPGPGRPADFGMSELLDAALERGLPVFGVCLGLQGMVEHFGGTLGTLARPVHGKPSTVELVDGGGTLFAGLPDRIRAGRYHSLFAEEATLPPQFRVTARTGDGVVMGIEHRALPLAAVQFHPESVMTTTGGTGRALIGNVVAGLTRTVPRLVGSRR